MITRLTHFAFLRFPKIPILSSSAQDSNLDPRSARPANHYTTETLREGGATVKKGRDEESEQGTRIKGGRDYSEKGGTKRTNKGVDEGKEERKGRVMS